MISKTIGIFLQICAEQLDADIEMVMCSIVGLMYQMHCVKRF